MQDNGMYLVYMCGALLVAQGVESVFHYPEGGWVDAHWNRVFLSLYPW